MIRVLFILAVMAVVLAVGVGEASAQDDFLSAVEAARGWHAPSSYLNWMKIAACSLLFMMWVRSTDWVSRDAQEVRMRYLRWNPIIFGTFLGGLILFLLIPLFWVGFPLLVVAYVAPLATYLVQRQRTVATGKQEVALEYLCALVADMLTDLLHLVGFVGLLVPVIYLSGMAGEHAHAILGIVVILAYPFVFVLAVLPKTHPPAGEWLRERIEKIAGAEKVDPHEIGPPVILKAYGGPTERDENVRLLSARQLPGFLDARIVLADGLSHRAHAVMLDYTQQAVGVHRMIDGVWHADEPLPRDQGDPLLEALKTLCGLNPQDRRSQQRGTFRTEYESAGYVSTFVCQGTKTGERAVIQFQEQKIRFESFDEIGMRPKIQEELREQLEQERGFVLLAAPPAGGLRSMTHLVVRNTDRYTREFLAIEEETKRYQEVENCPVSTYNASAGESPASILPKLIRAMPDVIVCRDLVNAETVNMLCEEVAEGRLIIGTVRAKDSVEALLRVLAIGAPAATLAQNVSAVLSQRLVRRLCGACKEAYTPTPQVLAQLRIPEGRVQALYRPPQEPDQVCPACGGLGYKGRTALFELLKVGDSIRKVLPNGPTYDQLRQAARKDGLRGFQEEGILLVAKGVTSLPELMRVLKQ